MEIIVYMGGLVHWQPLMTATPGPGQRLLSLGPTAGVLGCTWWQGVARSFRGPAVSATFISGMNSRQSQLKIELCVIKNMKLTIEHLTRTALNCCLKRLKT